MAVIVVVVAVGYDEIAPTVPHHIQMKIDFAAEVDDSHVAAVVPVVVVVEGVDVGVRYGKEIQFQLFPLFLLFPLPHLFLLVHHTLKPQFYADADVVAAAADAVDE